MYIFFAVVALLGLLAATARAPSPVRAAVPGERITTRTTPTKMRSGQRTVVSGVLSGASGPVPGEMLELQIDPVPYGQFLNVAHALTKAGGRYRFPAVRIDRDTHLRVLDVGANGPIGPTVTVTVQPPAYPASGRVIAAAHYLAGRAGVTAFAVVDDEGRLAGANLHMRFHSASVVKSMLLVAYLRMLAQQHRSLDGASQALLYPMIHSSDNGAATAVLAAVGEDALDRVARVAHMRDYEPAGATWGFTEVSAADLARFFFHQDSLIPRRFDGVCALAALEHRIERELGDTGCRASRVQSVLQGRLAARSRRPCQSGWPSGTSGDRVLSVGPDDARSVDGIRRGND